jgi:hypothetical protein
MATLAEIRAKLLSQQTKTENRSSGDNATFPFWNTPENQSSIIRFLPDGDPENVYFWVERLQIRLPFQGVKGDNDREVMVSVPCMEMFGETCPILAETRPWWKEPSLEQLARRYWKKKTYIFQGFVVNSAFEEKDPPENPIRRFTITKPIFEIIKSSLMNPEMEDLPIDYINGRDFKLTKTTQGQFANYSTSNWSFKTRSLSPDEQAALNKYSLFNLKDYLGKKPTPEEVQIIKEMFQASVEDQAYDPDRWGAYFKPFGLNIATDTRPPATVVPINRSAATPFPKDFVKPGSDPNEMVDLAPEIANAEAKFMPPVVDEEVNAPEPSASDVMARLQARNQPQPTKVEPSPVNKQDPMEILRRIKEKQGMAQ